MFGGELSESIFGNGIGTVGTNKSDSLSEDKGDQKQGFCIESRGRRIGCEDMLSFFDGYA